MVNQEIEKNHTKSALREYVEAVVIAVLLALFIRAFVVQAFKIPSGSMKTTLLVGDHILVNKFVYGIRPPFTDTVFFRFVPNRRDIVVFRYPVDPSKDFIKRVIGIPGDTIRIENKKVYVNGELQEEPYAVHSDPRIIPPGTPYPRDNMDTVKVPPNSLFVMGDNRDESYDSRFWKFVDMSELKGKAFIIYWSWNPDGKFTMSSSDGLIRWDRMGKLLH